MNDSTRRWNGLRLLGPLLGFVLIAAACGDSTKDALASPDGTELSIESFAERELAASGAPGVSYAVVDDGEITSVVAHGLVRIGTDTAVDPDTPFVIGSISKSFTALAVMQLVEAGEVDLDAELLVYLESFSGRPSGAATIRQLLSHTSGFSTLQGNESRTGVRSGIDALERAVDELIDVEPAFEPGSRWEYSNTNYQILGRLIEVVSGQQFHEYVATNILKPVGMVHSFVADGQTHESMATGHTPWFGTKRPRSNGATDRITAPQGGVIASSGDLALYMQMMLNGQDDVLSAAGKATMMAPTSTLSPNYGFGWYLDPTNGTVWHSGSTPGFETLLTMIPDEGRGAVVLVNAGSGLGFGETTDLRTGIVANALGLDHEGNGSRWLQKSLFVSLVVLPLVYLASMWWAWNHRAAIRAKPGFSGRFSWWFPVLTTGIAAWVILWLIPQLYGVPIGTLRRFQPDLGLAMIATAATGVIWATFRLALVYSGHHQVIGRRAYNLLSRETQERPS